MIYSNLLESEDYIDVGKAVSDGLVHLVQQTAAAAWIVALGTDFCMSAYYLMTNINAVSSYRSEVEGIFQSLKHLEYLNITPTKVRQWCNNERSVISSREISTRMAGMIQTDANIILAIHHLKNELHFPVDCRHVYGYQDSKDEKKQEKRESGN